MTPAAVNAVASATQIPPAAAGFSRVTIGEGTVRVGHVKTEFVLEAWKMGSPGTIRRKRVRRCRKCHKSFVMQVTGQQYCRSPCRSPTDDEYRRRKARSVRANVAKENGGKEPWKERRVRLGSAGSR